MRTTKERTGKAPQTAAAAVAAPATKPAAVPETAAEKLIAWVRKHPQVTSWSGFVVVAAAALIWWNISATRASEAEARTSLQSARIAFESHNLGLASSELARVRENYSGTKAAEEAALLLAQVRMQQGQSDQAMQLLQETASGASRDYKAQAYGLLGAALENAGRATEAAQAYERGADAAELPFLKAQFLSDAGRAWVSAHDTTHAMAAYKRITSDLKETGPVTEATVRLGELSKGRATP